ncbi:MAG TPA: shikimate kinase [Microthrixaceae bacterium]|nr:shikimate kinase [Microthrixaceae bacterium]
MTGPSTEETSAAPAVCLIGMPGAGKSTLGPMLAARLGARFVDLDHEVERVAGRAVAEIFETDGEESFRRLEAEALGGLVVRGGVVVACGGGIVTTEAGRAALAGARTVLLEVELAELETRIAAQPVDRPLLAGDLGARLVELDRDRRDAYRAAADVIVDAGSLPRDVVVDRLVAALEARS